MIEIKNLSKKFSKQLSLNNVNLVIEPGIHGLLGPNGAGKTTLFRCITGIIEMDAGEIIAPSNISYLPQHFGFYPYFKVKDTMMYFSKLKNIPTDEARLENESLLKKVNLFSEKYKKVKHLSGGMQRRLGIAIALQGNPSVLLVDEPTVGLDPEERMNFKQVLFEISRDISVIISTHIVSDLEGLCEKIIIMNNGEILFHDSAEALIQVAENKVYIAPSKDFKPSGNDYIVKKYLAEGDTKIRFISEEEQNFPVVAASIEDAYILYIRKSESNAEN